MRNIVLVIAASALLMGCGKNSNTGTSSVDPSASPQSDSSVSVEGGEKSEAQTWLDKGNELYKNDKDVEAAKAFEEAIRLDPNLAEAHYKLGLAYIVAGTKADADKEFKAATEGYEKVLKSDSLDAKSQYYLGDAYNKIGKSEEAVRALKEAVRLNPEDADYYFDLGTTYTKLNQYQEAVSAFQKSVDLDPEDFRAQEALSNAREALQHRNASVKQQQDTLRKQKENSNKETIGAGLPPAIKQKP